MNKVFIIPILFFFLSCTNSYDLILNGLSNNYVLLFDEMDKNIYLEHYNLTEVSHKTKFKEYRNAVSNFYAADKDILTYLLKYEKDTVNVCDWIKTRNPLSSKLNEMDFITNSKGALVLFDNFLSNESDIRIPDYIDKLSYKGIVHFYSSNKNLSKEELKKEYRSYIKGL
ncbi:hypothetical protein [uncultured Tenacibaculum sp.]|uniref:hypothetical protein n=1 Tax=uncultured Tenacibaculum sp. TaxID=174713 RepID=UPI00263338DA|nr:hypothetical protein [uncultured Tenacibaculum sp.]